MGVPGVPRLEVEEREERVGRGRCPCLPLAEDARRLRPVPHRPVDRHRVDRVRREREACHDPEVAAPASPACPEQVGVVLRAARADHAIRSDDRHVADVVARQAELSPRVADTPAECQPCDADRRTRSTGDRDAVRSEHAIDVHQPRAGADARRTSGRIHPDRGEPRDVDHDPCRARVPRVAVPTAPRGDRDVVPPGPDNRLADVLGARAVDDRERVCSGVEPWAVEAPRYVVPGAAPADDGAADGAPERGEVRRLRRAVPGELERAAGKSESPCLLEQLAPVERRIGSSSRPPSLGRQPSHEEQPGQGERADRRESGGTVAREREGEPHERCPDDDRQHGAPLTRATAAPGASGGAVARIRRSPRTEGPPQARPPATRARRRRAGHRRQGRARPRRRRPATHRRAGGDGRATGVSVLPRAAA